MVKYINNRIKVKIICSDHGIFEQKPNNHLSGDGCPRCKESKGEKLISKILDENNINYVKEYKFDGSKYDYSKTNYIDSKTKVKIICKKHGTFKTLPIVHINGSDCRMCFIEKLTSNTEDFIKKSKEVHENILPLPFDFYLPEHNICIEFDGMQHFKPIDYWGGRSI